MRWTVLAGILCFGAAALAQTMPDAATLFNNASVKEALGKNTGTTDALKALRQTGSELLFEPGRRGVDAAYEKSDPTSAAVVIVDKGAGNRPTVDPDPTGEIRKDLALLKGKSQELLPGLENITAVGACRPITTTVSGDVVTRTCDIRSFESAGTYVEKHCSITLENLTRAQSLFRCTNEAFRERVFELAVPVVPTYTTTTTMTCLEGKRNAEIKTCTVTFEDKEQAREEAYCVRPVYTTTRKVCTKRLKIKPTATCVPGAVVRARAHDAGNLTEDSVPGADTLEVAYACGNATRPVIRLGVNTKTGKDVDYFVETADTAIDIVRIVGGNTLRFTGAITCEKDACSAPVTLTVFRASGEDRVIAGTLQTTLFFSPFAVTSETEYWEESCQVL